MRPEAEWNMEPERRYFPYSVRTSRVQRFYLFKCTHNNLLRSIEIFECRGFIKGLLTAGTVPARISTGTDATGSFPVTLLLPSARPESFESFIEKKFQSKHQGNRYSPPNKPERPWPLSNLFNCIFGVVDVFFSSIFSRIFHLWNVFKSLTPEILFFQPLCWFDEIFDTLQAMCHGCDYYVIIECAQTICAPLFQNAQYGLMFGGWNRHCACAQRKKKQYKTSKQQRQRNIKQGIRAHITRLICLTK